MFRNMIPSTDPMKDAVTPLDGHHRHARGHLHLELETDIFSHPDRTVDPHFSRCQPTEVVTRPFGRGTNTLLDHGDRTELGGR